MISLSNTSEFLLLLEAVIRGAGGGVLLLLAIALASNNVGQRTRWLAALFTIAVGIYILVSGEQTRMLFQILLEPAVVISIWATVFFWWFVASLFDDDFQWHWWRVAPIFVLPTLYYLQPVFGGHTISAGLGYTHILLNALFFSDALRLALFKAGDDLVDERRKFRFVAAIIIGIFGVGIAIAEVIDRNSHLPDLVRLFQAIAIAGLSVFFGIWLLKPRTEIFAGPNPVSLGVISRDERISAADRPVYQRLARLMDEGLYRTEGLTVAGLAAKVGVPEHQLRKLINGALGYRNFSAYLNASRIEEAKATLADPEQARTQIIQIALGLGFSSISPFNRAFKNATGQTPSSFRRQALKKS